MIKKNHLFILLMFTISVYGQAVYTFDYKLQFKNSFNQKQHKILTYMMSSKNPYHILYMYEKNRGALFDYEKNMRRDFTVITGTDYNFVNRPFTPTDNIKINHILVKKIGEHRYSIKCYPENKNINSNLELKVQLKPFSKDIISFYYSDLDYKINDLLIKSLKEKLEANYNYVIESYTIYYRNGTKWSNSLEKVDEINLKITP